MVGGVNSAAGYQYFLQLRRAQGAGTPSSYFLNALNANENSSTGNNFSVFQTALTGQAQDTQSSSQTNSTEFLVNLLQSAGQMGSTNASAGTTGSSPSQQNTLDQTYSQMNTIGQGTVTQDELAALQSSLTGLTQTGALNDPNASGTTEESSTTSVTSLIQQAISKYLQLSPAGMVGAAALGGVLTNG
jgi:hypothetical protein